MSDPPVGKLLCTVGVIFVLTMPTAGLLLSPPDEYLRTLFILLSLVGPALYADGRFVQKLEQERMFQRDKEWIYELMKLLMCLSPLLCSTAVLSWVLWAYPYCYYITVSGLCLIVPIATLRGFLFEGKKAQTKTV